MKCTVKNVVDATIYYPRTAIKRIYNSFRGRSVTRPREIESQISFETYNSKNSFNYDSKPPDASSNATSLTEADEECQALASKRNCFFWIR